MNKRIALGMIGMAGVIAFRCLPRERRERLASAMKRRIGERLERGFANLPEDFPPKLIMSVLPQLKAQNEQIIAILREQNELLKEQQRSSMATTAD